MENECMGVAEGGTGEELKAEEGGETGQDAK